MEVNQQEKTQHINDAETIFHEKQTTFKRTVCVSVKVKQPISGKVVYFWTFKLISIVYKQFLSY